MLKLRRLELSGFKSFVDPITLDVHGGMTAIVGPNGCGKSNIADAVVWALGERSAKSLRGEKMEDVIFAGAKGRKPLGMAEVTVELSSDTTFAGTDDGRVVIGRRVYRSGESQYLLNGKSVRLKDVKDLLMDTGLGIRAYSMIEQGKIGMILSSKPQERRRLLEEAAGITRYRERRRVAEFKLEEARGNLNRLDDIVVELERSLRSLKRQANAATRFKTRQEEYHELLRRVMDGRWAIVHQKLSVFQGQIGELVERDAGLTATLHGDEATFAEARETLDQLARELAERHGHVADLAAKIEGKQEFLKGSRSRLQEIAERLAAGEATAEHRNQRLAELGKSLNNLNEKRGLLVSERQQAASEVDEDDTRISQVEALLSETEERMEGYRTRLLASINDLTARRNRLHREQMERQKGELRRGHVEEELQRKTKELEAALEGESRTREQVDEMHSRAAEVEEQIELHGKSISQIRRRQQSAQVIASQIESSIEDLQRRQHVLYELEEKQEERRALLKEALEQAGLGERAFLADEIQVPEGWAASLDLFLGELEDAVLLAPDDDALGVAQSLTSGRATGRLLRPHGTSNFLHLRIDDPAVRASLGEALGLSAEMAAALPPAYLVESSEDAQRLARANPGVAFISRDRLWAQAGAVHFHGAEAKPGHLARERELAELHAKLPPLESRLTETRQELQQLATEIKSHDDSGLECQSQLTELRKELAVAEALHSDAAARHHRLASENQTLTDELAEIEREIERLSSQLEILADELEQAESAHKNLEDSFDAAQEEAQRARDDRESTRTSGASRRGRLDVLAERLDSHEQEMARIRREIEEHDQHLQLWTTETKRLSERQAAVEGSMAQAEGELQSALENRTDSEESVVSKQERLDEHRAQMRQLEERIEIGRAARDELRAEISQARVGEAAVGQDSEHLAEAFRESFQQDPPTQPAEVPDNLDELEFDLGRRKEVLERMGPVNLLAASEFEEQSERHEFLTAQRADVAQSAERLRQTIREINETSSQRFRETFEEVNENFRQVYSDLFRGGEAEMRLLDEEDVLESVIEIVARPPGKRLQNIMLLSGGEKALTAIALLFALFRTKPSPFCILDEVDAPLDDVNTLRFVELIKQMSGETQFILITHNKLTMESANLLYGVTMQERGVSNIVAVELDDVQPAAEPMLEQDMLATAS